MLMDRMDAELEWLKSKLIRLEDALLNVKSEGYYSGHHGEERLQDEIDYTIEEINKISRSLEF